jgi:prepilin-type N-terminal cleavage/methylation domain-containing protein
MSWRDQRGMTLVELLVAMTVTSIVLVGITGVLVAGYHAADQWGQKISEAQTANQLAGRLDQDLHRYVPCKGSGGDHLDLCLPGDVSHATVTYVTSPPGGPCPCTLLRKDAVTGVRSVVTRDLVAQPSFVLACTPSNTVYTGYVDIQNLVYQPSGQAPVPQASPPGLVLYFRAPHGSCP